MKNTSNEVLKLAEDKKRALQKALILATSPDEKFKLQHLITQLEEETSKLKYQEQQEEQELLSGELINLISLIQKVLEEQQKYQQKQSTKKTRIFISTLTLLFVIFVGFYFIFYNEIPKKTVNWKVKEEYTGKSMDSIDIYNFPNKRDYIVTAKQDCVSITVDISEGDGKFIFALKKDIGSIDLSPASNTTLREEKEIKFGKFFIAKSGKFQFYLENSEKIQEGDTYRFILQHAAESRYKVQFSCSN